MENPQAEIPGGAKGNSTPGDRVDLSGVAKRGPGRPPGSKTKKSGTPDAPKPANGGNATSPDDAGFLADAIVFLFETGDELLAKTALQRMAQVLPDKVAEFEELQKEVQLNQRDKELIRKCVFRLAQKYSIVGKFAPEFLLLGVTAQYAARQARCFRFIEKMAAERKASEPKKTLPPVSSN